VSELASPTDAWTAAHGRIFGALFATCGAAGAQCAQEAADLALALTSLAGQFAWHAELLVDLLPTRSGIDASALVARPVPGADEALARLDRLHRREQWSALGVVLARVVVPRLLAGVASMCDRTDARVDGPRARSLRLVARDLRDALELLEPLAERALAAQGAFARITSSCAEVERALVDAGVAVGFVAEVGFVAAPQERPEGLTAPVE
jgi:hypothetical protein